ncbi:MAG: HIT domain-containing protein [Aigarchaeota archaeon]|nr:HIT domain-containing protein [Aigarchaeota archaeon]
MRILWAPWRMAYIRLFSSRKDEECFLCRAAGGDDDMEKLVVFRGGTCFVILNRYPYNNGHLMIAPYRHISSILDLNEEESIEMINLLKLSIRALKEEYNPDGFNVGLNLGRGAGAGVEDHIHFHVVPRWIGDTNFMPVISDTKVIPEALHETWRRIKERFSHLTA